MTPATISAAIRAAAPHADADAWSSILLAPMQASGIVTPRRVAAFVGNCAIESWYFSRLSENLHYTTATRIRDVWDTHFATDAAALPYVNNPERLANHVYAGVDGNGDEASGDGWLFRGRGLLDLTGRANYAGFAASIGKTAEAIADWLATPQGAAQSACWFWATAWHGHLNTFADAWALDDVARAITGSRQAESARRDACTRALAALEPAPARPGPTVTDPDHSADALMAAEQQRVADPSAPGGSPG